MAPLPEQTVPLPEQVVALLRGNGGTVATAESLTGGDLCSALVGVPGASSCVRAGIVAYTEPMKSRLLGVAPSLIARAGVVSEEVAVAMAEGAREATGARYAVATTGVAGPEPHGGLPPGRVCLAVSGPAGTVASSLDLPGSRAEVRRATVEAALTMLEGALRTAVTEP